MLILAGVSLNAIIGDNGIITRAQEANIQSSIASLEEYLQLKYTENYEEMTKYQSKIEGLTNVCSDYFYIPANENVGGLRYVTDSDGHALYLIKKSGLPDEIRESLVGGDAGEGTYIDYQSLNDVYGVTSNLKVYYCSGGVDSIKGIAKENLDNDDPEREVFKADSSMGKNLQEYDQNGDGIINAEESKSVTELTVTADSGITSLSDLYNLTSLKELILDGVVLNDLSGIDKCSQLNYVYFKNYSTDNIAINDYSALSGVKNLTYLYFYRSSDKQIKDLCEGIKNADFTKLEYLRVMGFYSEYSLEGLKSDRKNRVKDNVRSNVTDLTPFSYLSSATKKAIKYVYLNHNQITNIKFLEGFENLYELYMPYNNISRLEGIESLKNLVYLYAFGNKLGTEEIETKNSAMDSLLELSDLKNLFYVDLSFNENLKHIEYIKNCNKLKYVYLENCCELIYDEVRGIKDIFLLCLDYQLNSKYSFAILSNDITRLDLRDQTVTVDQFKSLEDLTHLTYLNLKNCKIIKESGEQLSSNELNSVSNEVFSCLRSMSKFSINGFSELSDGSFLSNLTELQYLDIRNTSLSTEGEDGKTLTNLNKLTKMKMLGLNFESINLSKLSATVSRLWPGGDGEIFDSGSLGLICDNKDILKTLSNCDDLTQLAIGLQGEGFLNATDWTLDLSNCTSLKNVQINAINIEGVSLPHSIEQIIVRANTSLDLHFKSNTDLTYLFIDRASTKDFDSIINSLYTNNVTVDNFEVMLTESENYGRVGDVLRNVSTLRTYNQSWGGKERFNFLDELNKDVEDCKLTTFKMSYSNRTDLSFLDGISSLKTIMIDASDIADISGIQNLINLSDIQLFNNKIVDISALKNLTKCTNLILNNNKISSVLPLENMSALAYLDLENNALYDVSNGKSNLEVLANLNQSGNLKTLKLKGNFFTNFDLVSGLTWTDWSGFNGK